MRGAARSSRPARYGRSAGSGTVVARGAARSSARGVARPSLGGVARPSVRGAAQPSVRGAARSSREERHGRSAGSGTEDVSGEASRGFGENAAQVGRRGRAVRGVVEDARCADAKDAQREVDVEDARGAEEKDAQRAADKETYGEHVKGSTFHESSRRSSVAKIDTVCTDMHELQVTRRRRSGLVKK